jgi:hypothetical protein
MTLETRVLGMLLVTRRARIGIANVWFRFHEIPSVILNVFG